MRLLTDLTPERYYELRKIHKYDQEIADALYVCLYTLRKWRKIHNVKVERYRSGPALPLEERVRIIEEMEGQPLEKIAKAVKLKDKASLRSWIDTKKREGYLRDWSYRKGWMVWC